MRTRFGHAPRIADENEITQPHARVPDDTRAHEAVQAPPPGPPSGPPPVPPRLARDAWPWLALLGVLAVAGLLVWLFVLHDRGAKGAVVPAVVGMRQQEAIARLTGAGFDVRAVVGPAKAPRGTVTAQKPGGGSRLDRGRTVVIDVSSGTPPPGGTTTTAAATTTAATTTAATTTAAPTSAVPGVTGQDAAAGAGQVEAAGFVAETGPVDAPGTAGTIVGEAPAGGSQAAAGSVVRLSVAAGASRPARSVPGVVGQKAGAARAALLDAKLTVKTEYRKAPAKSTGVVLSQSPSAGGTAPAYTQVTIVVGG